MPELIARQGIYVPSMVVGGLMGRIVGHFVQWLVYLFPGCVMARAFL